jgi:predicted RNase H-like HicB family nuclease
MMLNLKYSLVIEATGDPGFFGFFSPDLEGFSGIGFSVEDCLYKTRWGMEEHDGLISEQRLPIPPGNPIASAVIRDEQRAAVA